MPSFILGFLAWIFCVAIESTLRVRVHNNQWSPPASCGNDNRIYVSWHANVFSFITHYARYPIGTFTLTDFKNQIFTRMVARLGWRTAPIIHGKMAFRQLARMIDEGYSIAIALDGPHGPAGKIKPGAAALARLTGKPIVPTRIRYTRYLKLWWRWDRYKIPYPFSRVEIIFGEPVRICETDNPEAIDKMLLSRLGDF